MRPNSTREFWKDSKNFLGYDEMPIYWKIVVLIVLPLAWLNWFLRTVPERIDALLERIANAASPWDE